MISPSTEVNDSVLFEIVFNSELQPLPGLLHQKKS